MTYKTLIIKKYPEIKRAVNSRAFVSHVEYKELLSLVNEKLAYSINKGMFEVNTIPQFWKYIQLIIYTSVVDLKRKVRYDHDDLDDCHVSVMPVVEQRMSAKALINNIFSTIKKDVHKQVALDILEHGEKYEDTAAKYNIHLNTVKAIVHRVRIVANRDYREVYQGIYN